jgi:molybdate transport system regulatory protein
MRRQIVVSSGSRKQGKTILACSLARRFHSKDITVACIKLSRGKHELSGIMEGAGRRGSDTWRYTESGASEAVLIQYSDPDELAALYGSLSFCRDICIWESNTLLELLEPDFHIHISSDSIEKPSASGLAARADIVTDGPLNTETSDRISHIVPGLMGIRNLSSFSIGGKHWLNLDDEPLFGEGRVELLKAVDTTGSILKAAEACRMPYKRAWILLHDTEDRLGAKLLNSDRGGKDGGGSSLTRLAENLIKIWERSEEKYSALLAGLEVP